jgi:hypothetical protein
VIATSALTVGWSPPIFDPLPYDLEIEADVVADFYDLDLTIRNDVANVAFAYCKHPRQCVDVDEFGERWLSRCLFVRH